MTASERLRELWAFRSIYGGPAEAAVMDALPLIADVVEAAESFAPTYWQNSEGNFSGPQLAIALSALREVLEEK